MKTTSTTPTGGTQPTTAAATATTQRHIRVNADSEIEEVRK